jgi:hypothetical protein
MSENTSLIGKITKYLVIGGAILLFIFLAFLIIRWIPSAVSGIANIGSSFTDRGSGDEIDVSLNRSEVLGDESFVVSWKYNPTEVGDYFIRYSCEDSLLFDIRSQNGDKRVICNTDFKLGDNLNSISLIPRFGKTNSLVDSDIEISYKTIDGGEVSSGKKIVTVQNTSVTDNKDNEFNASTGNFAGSRVESTPVDSTGSQEDRNDSLPTGRQETQNTISTRVASSPADLQISNITNLGNSRLSFVVRNVGGRSSGNWFFSYTDAKNSSRILTSPLQISMRPGQGVLLTVRFDSQDSSSQLVNIKIDSTNAISESNESNNSASVFMTGQTNGNRSSNSGNFDRNDDADFVIDRLEVGRLSGSRFIENNKIDKNDDAAVRFVVRNRGGETTNDWRFEIRNLPYNRNKTFESKRQNKLRPGEEREFVVEFENPDEGRYSIRVEVDSDDDTDEENERNNDESERLEVED